jgi:threonine dehydrogenase-like Zn-dependent dehydrogenase
VVCEGMQPCLRCRRCLAGETNLCENYSQLGFTEAGGGAELVVVPRIFVHVLAPEVSPAAATLIEPAASIVRMLRRLAHRPGESLGVVGVGTLGAIALLLGRRAGARPLVAFGIREAELELAARLGADEVVDVSAAEPIHQLDVVLEVAGSVAAVELATRIARAGGRAGLLGLAGHGKQLSLGADWLPNRDLQLIGGASYDRAAWAETVAMVNSGELDPRPALGSEYAIDDFAAAY